MIKTRISAVVVALSFAAAAFCFGETKTTEPAASPAAAKTGKAMAPKKEAAKTPAPANPQMGTWKFNEAKSKVPAGMGKNSIVVYAEQGDKIKVTVDGTDKDGKPTHSVWVGKFDGKAYPVRGNLPYNSVGYRVINDRTNAIQAIKDGKVMWSGTITVTK